MVSGRSNYTMNRSRLPLVAFVIFVIFALSQGETLGLAVWFVGAIEKRDRSRFRERSRFSIAMTNHAGRVGVSR